jgi:hypothetical protein
MAFGVVVLILEITVIGLLLLPAAMYLQLMATGHILGQWARIAYGPGQPSGAPAQPSAPAQ